MVSIMLFALSIAYAVDFSVYPGAEQNSDFYVYKSCVDDSECGEGGYRVAYCLP